MQQSRSLYWRIGTLYEIYRIEIEALFRKIVLPKQLLSEEALTVGSL